MIAFVIAAQTAVIISLIAYVLLSARRSRDKAPRTVLFDTRTEQEAQHYRQMNSAQRLRERINEGDKARRLKADLADSILVAYNSILLNLVELVPDAAHDKLMVAVGRAQAVRDLQSGLEAAIVDGDLAGQEMIEASKNMGREVTYANPN